MAIEKHRLGTQLAGGAQRHRRMHTESPRFIAGGCHDAALVALPANDYRQALQLRPRQKLHGDEECIHINMEYGSACFGRGRFGAAVLRAEMCQLRHKKQGKSYRTVCPSSSSQARG